MGDTLQATVIDSVSIIVSNADTLTTIVQESMNDPEWLVLFKGIKEIIITLSVITGAIVAMWGLRTWKAQIKGKTEYDLARRLLKAIYKVRESIRIIRAPFISSSEIVKAMENAGYSDQEIEQKIHSYESDQAVYQSRYNHLADSMSELRVELLEAEVHWGKEIHEHMKPLNKSVGKLRININRLIKSKKRRNEGGYKLTSEEVNEMDEVLYEISQNPDEDAFTKEVYSAVEELEEYIKPHLSL